MLINAVLACQKLHFGDKKDAMYAYTSSDASSYKPGN